jgi:hypothetical protein
MGRKRRQENMSPQKAKNNIIKNLMECKGDESPVADFKRMMKRMFDEAKEELRENMQKQLNEY